MLLLSVAPDAPARAQPTTRFEPSFLLPVDVGWTTSLGGSPRHDPAFDRERVYIALRNDNVVAVDLVTGERAWTVEQRLDHPPVPGAGALFAASGSRLYCRRASDGALLWSREFDSTIVVPPIWNTGWLVVATGTGQIVVLRSADGLRLWRRDLNSTPTARPAIAGDRLFVPLVNGHVAVLALRSGALIWERELSGRPQEILPLDALYVGSTDNHLYRLALDDGAIDWAWRTGGDIVGRPTADLERVYFNSRDNVLRALDRRNGARRWRRPLGARPADGPLRIDSLVVVAGVSPAVELFDTETGLPRGRYVTSGELAAMPHIVPDAHPPAPHMVLLTGTGQIIGLVSAAGPPQLSLKLPPQPFLPRPAAVTLPEFVDWFPIDVPGGAAPATAILPVPGSGDPDPPQGPSDLPVPTR